MDKSTVVNIFPKLKDDKAFEITSPEDPNYNCIAWAYKMYKDRWMSTPKGVTAPSLDAVTWWPDGIEDGNDIQCLKDAFSSIGFTDCDSWEHEDGYTKVALYYNPQNRFWTHAARESRTGKFWLSKLGQSYDIHHGTPYTIEEDKYYGKVFCIMKRKDE